MGADIHLYVEYDDGDKAPFSNLNSIYGFSDGEFLIPRNYYLFSVLAGIRSNGEFSPKYSPRGMPVIASRDTINAFHFNILDDPSERLEEEDVLRSQAEEWAAKKMSYIRDSWIKKNGFVSNPNYHTPSWLYCSEINECFDSSPHKIEEMPREFLVIVELLESLEKHFGKERARIVFWFDN